MTPIKETELAKMGISRYTLTRWRKDKNYPDAPLLTGGVQGQTVVYDLDKFEAWAERCRRKDEVRVRMNYGTKRRKVG